MKNADDRFLVQQIRAGNLHAFTGIVSKYQSKLLTIILKITPNREDAEDILQEVFIKIFKTLGQFNGDAAFSTWLYRVAYNTAVSEWRKRKLPFVPINENTSTETDLSDESVGAASIEQQLSHLDTAIRRLSPDDAFLITLYYLDEQSIEAISQISHLSVSNVKVRLHRIRKKLAEEIHQLIQHENNQ